MSKHMQLAITVRPYYQSDLEGSYPKLARHLGRLDANLVKQSPSLYELVGQLDQVLYRFEGTPFRKVLLSRREWLLTTHQNIQKNIADWNLARADQLLYALEDAFEEMELELD